MLIAEIVVLTHASDELKIILSELRQHVERSYVVGLVIFDPLVPDDLADGVYGVTANFADTFGDRIRCFEDLRRLLIEQQMVVAEMRPGDMPMEILRLHIEGKDI